MKSFWIAKRRWIPLVVVLVIAIFIGAAILLTGRSSHKSSLRRPTISTSSTTTGPTTSLPAAPAPNSSTTTTSTAKDVEPTSQTLRTPVHCTAAGSPKAGPLPGDDPENGKRWVTVGHLNGACDASSALFSLRGIDTRLAYTSDATNFTAFLIDAKQGLDATDGYADAECAGPCSDHQALVDQAGNYSLRVQADGGPWEIEIQEYR